MKILVSDYDGTICIDNQVSSKTIQKIQQWKAQGNIFILASGRDVRLITSVMETYRLPVDYFICNNGAVIYDQDYQIIEQHLLPPALVEEIIGDILLQESFYFVLSTVKDRYLLEGYQKGKEVYNQYSAILKKIELKDHDVYAIDTRYQNEKIMQENYNQLMKKYKNRVTLHPNIETLDFSAVGTSKQHALQTIVRNYVSNAEVITIGDGLNDLSMIEKNIGYTMQWAIDTIKEQAQGVVTSIDEVIDKHM